MKIPFKNGNLDSLDKALICLLFKDSRIPMAGLFYGYVGCGRSYLLVIEERALAARFERAGCYFYVSHLTLKRRN